METLEHKTYELPAEESEDSKAYLAQLVLQGLIFARQNGSPVRPQDQYDHYFKDAA